MPTIIVSPTSKGGGPHAVVGIRIGLIRGGQSLADPAVHRNRTASENSIGETGLTRGDSDRGGGDFTEKSGS